MSEPLPGGYSLSFSVDSETADQRIDRTVADAFPELSRSRIQHMAENGCITVNGKTVGKSFKPKVDDEVAVYIEPAQDDTAQPENIPLDIVDNKAPCNTVNKVTRTAGYNNRHTPVNKTGLNFLRHEQENKHYYNNRRKNRQKNRLILHGAERRTGVLDIADADKTEKNIHAAARRKAVDNSNFYNLVDSHKRGNHQKGYCLDHKNLKNLFFKETSEARMAGMIVVVIVIIVIIVAV